MDLERRITMLENELKIIKNQIQNTLLDIQEQLVAERVSALGPEPAQAPAERPDTTQRPSNAHPQTSSTTAPATRKVSLREVRATQRERIAACPDVGRPAEMDLAKLARLIKWLHNNIAHVGPDATRKALEVADEAGQLPADLRDHLFSLLPKTTQHSSIAMSELLKVYRSLNEILRGEPEMGDVIITEAADLG